MAGNLKKIFIIGNVGKEPEMRLTPDGTQVTSFSVAVNEPRRRNANAEGGQPEEKPTWFRVSSWGRQAEIAKDLLRPGTSVFVSGAFTAREFTGNDGIQRTSLEVRADDMQILTPKGGAEGGSFDDSSSFGGGQSANRPSFPSGNRQGQGGAGRPAPNVPDEDDGDIPF